MAFQLSPGVVVTERDLTSVVPAVATTAGGFAGAFQWGPVDQVVTVDSENQLVERFGKPNDTVFKSFFTAANFLSYGNNLQVIRVVNKATAKNAAVVSANAVLITNEDNYLLTYADGSGVFGEFAAKYPGVLGNSIKVSMADGNVYSRRVNWICRQERRRVCRCCRRASPLSRCAEQIPPPPHPRREQALTACES